LSEVIRSIVDLQPIGVFNVGSRGGMSKAEFDFAFARVLSLPTIGMKEVDSANANFLKARRPKNMLMNLDKLEAILGFKLPTIESEILKISKEYV